MIDNGTDGIGGVNAIIVVGSVAIATTRITQVFSVQFLQVLFIIVAIAMLML